MDLPVLAFYLLDRLELQLDLLSILHPIITFFLLLVSLQDYLKAIILIIQQQVVLVDMRQHRCLIQHLRVLLVDLKPELRAQLEELLKTLRVILQDDTLTLPFHESSHVPFLENLHPVHSQTVNQAVPELPQVEVPILQVDVPVGIQLLVFELAHLEFLKLALEQLLNVIRDYPHLLKSVIILS